MGLATISSSWISLRELRKLNGPNSRRWCDRRFGVGADGLLLLDIQGPQHLSMVLFNADGSRAEMSGNGIRCLVQAAHRQANASSSLATTYTVETDAGQRIVR